MKRLLGNLKHMKLVVTKQIVGIKFIPIKYFYYFLYHYNIVVIYTVTK